MHLTEIWIIILYVLNIMENLKNTKGSQNLRGENTKKI